MTISDVRNQVMPESARRKNELPCCCKGAQHPPVSELDLSMIVPTLSHIVSFKVNPHSLELEFARRSGWFQLSRVGQGRFNFWCMHCLLIKTGMVCNFRHPLWKWTSSKFVSILSHGMIVSHYYQVEVELFWARNILSRFMSLELLIWLSKWTLKINNPDIHPRVLNNEVIDRCHPCISLQTRFGGKNLRGGYE